MGSKISFHRMDIYGIKLYGKYNIYDRKQKIGEISFTKKMNIFVIGYFKILEYHRGNHYGYQVVDYILSHYKVNCIIGQTLYEARGFWNKCIKRFNGQRMNIATCANCSSSFVIPRYKIDHDEMEKLLKIGYGIE